jgi:hypothetical protein
MSVALLETTPCERCRWAISAHDSFCALCEAEVPFLDFEPRLAPGPDGRRQLILYAETSPRTLNIRNRTSRRLNLRTELSGLPLELPSRIRVGAGGAFDLRLEPGRLPAPAAGVLTLSADDRHVSITIVVYSPPMVWIGIVGQRLVAGSPPIYTDEERAELPVTVGADSPVRVTGLVVTDGALFMRAPALPIELGRGQDWSAPPLIVPSSLSLDTPIPLAIQLTIDGVGNLHFEGHVVRHRPAKVRITVPRQPINEDAVLQGSDRMASVVLHVQNDAPETVAVLTGIAWDAPWLRLAGGRAFVERALDRDDPAIDVTLDVLPAVLPTDRDQITTVVHVSFRDAVSGVSAEVGYPVTVEVRRPSALATWICVDFGTTATCAAYSDPRSEALVPKLAELEDLGGEAPTLLFFEDVRNPARPKIRIIPRASAELAPSPYHVAMNFKAELETDTLRTHTDSNNLPFPVRPSDLVAHYLRDYFSRFTSATGSVPRRVMLTYPAVFGPRSKKALLEGARRALGDECSVRLGPTEPEALLISYVSRLFDEGAAPIPEEGLSIAVVDIGGGTTDTAICVIRRTQGGGVGLSVLGVGGNFRVGGEWQTFELVSGVKRINHQAADYPLPSAFDRMWAAGAESEDARRNYWALMEPIVSLKHDAGGQLRSLFEVGGTPDVRAVELTAQGRKALISFRAWPTVQDKPDGDGPFMTAEEFRNSTEPGLKRVLQDLSRQATRLFLRGDLTRAYALGKLLLVPDFASNKFVLGVTTPEGVAWHETLPMTEKAEEEIRKGVMNLFSEDASPLKAAKVDFVIGGEYEQLPTALRQWLRESDATFMAPFDRLVLCGNGARLGKTAGDPVVQRLAATIFSFDGPGMLVDYHPDPKAGVAIGAWLYANSGGAVTVDGLGRTVWDVGVVWGAMSFKPLFPAGTIPGAVEPQLLPFRECKPYEPEVWLLENRDRSVERPTVASSSLVKIGRIPLPDEGSRSGPIEITLYCEADGVWRYSWRMKDRDGCDGEMHGPLDVALER